ncbi:DUF421 domain-containing protein [Shouchella clausii]|uniref:DUF421 domain-containing protein n=1 Tax=Shouchella clausii TaxID=79880 RepID=UPI000BA5B95F|nr:DUF421 domain-containing protein [Shouchella clausii]MDO7284253.1 DUF421 domain-containing protein [Shouchella clausii]MDO7304348.1 DUF421 domain-containing protein [Shouchella clausii]PAF09412.1 hypothetical protein CHH65_09955 [Shouchella clausii]
MGELLQTSVELAIGLVALLILTRVMGKTSFAQITPFDFISALILGELVGNAIYDEKVKIGTILFSIFIWGVLLYLMGWLTQKFRKTRKILEGSPSIIIQNGHLNRAEMKKNKLDMNQLQHLLRKQQAFSVREVEHAILETDGTISVLKKSQYDLPTYEDLNVPEKPVYLPVTFINDGAVDWENLHKAGFNENWLKKQLDQQQIDKFEDVFYMEWKQDEGVYIEKM